LKLIGPVLLLATISLGAALALPISPVQIGEDLLYGFREGNDLWLGTPRDGVFVVNRITGDIRHMTEGSGVPMNRTTCGAYALGRIWLGSQQGLYSSKDSGVSWQRIGEGHLPSPLVNCIFSDNDSIWVGTSRGVASLGSDGQWTIYSAADGLPDDWVLSIYGLADLLWFGTMRGGVAEFNRSSGAWRSWSREDGLLSNTVFSISASNEYLFAGTTSGLSVLDRRGAVWMSYGHDVLPSPNVYSLSWDEGLEWTWVGTGCGLAKWDPQDKNVSRLTKIGEIELGKINAILVDEDAVWVLRPSTLWFLHRTTGIIGFDVGTSSWVRPIILDVLVDQSGYSPGDPKTFTVQSNEPLEGNGTFSVLAGGKEVYHGVLGPRVDRRDWDAYYWTGDFSDLLARGNFSIRVEIEGVDGRSHPFEVDNDVLLHRCGETIYDFLYYMRDGFATEYRPKPRHLDDGVLPNGTHIDVTGGWQCAGQWAGKWSEYHAYVLFNLLLARDMRPEFFDAIDRDKDGLSDILDEAKWGGEFLLKMQVRNGSFFHEVENVQKTDGIIGTPDDRKIRGWMPTHSGLLAVAGLAGTSALVSDRYPQDASRFLEGALRGFTFYGGRVTGAPVTSVSSASMMLACLQLTRATDNSSYLDLAEAFCNETLNLPYSTYRGPFVPCALGYYLELNPSTLYRDRIISYVVAHADALLASNLGDSNPLHPFDVPTFHLYLMDPEAAAALFAYRYTGNRSYEDYALSLINCHLGVNPYGICMLEGVGTVNSPGYASNFRSPTNPRGAVPGSIPQGIRMRDGRPYYDTSISPEFQTCETWLINTNFLEAISLIPEDEGTYPLEIGENVSAFLFMLFVGSLFSMPIRAGRSS